MAQFHYLHYVSFCYIIHAQMEAQMCSFSFNYRLEQKTKQCFMLQKTCFSWLFLFRTVQFEITTVEAWVLNQPTMNSGRGTKPGHLISHHPEALFSPTDSILSYSFTRKGLCNFRFTKISDHTSHKCQGLTPVLLNQSPRTRSCTGGF